MPGAVYRPLHLETEVLDLAAEIYVDNAAPGKSFHPVPKLVHATTADKVDDR